MKYILTIAAGFILTAFFSCEREISVSQAESFIKIVGAGSHIKATGVAVLSDGGYAVCGTDSSRSGTQMVLYKTDAYGNVMDGFPKYFTEPGMNTGANTIVAKNGGQNGFLLSGYIQDASGDKDIYLVKTSPDGSYNWSQSYGSAEDEEVLHAAEGIGYEFILSGYQEKRGELDIMIMAVDQGGDSIPLSLFYSKPSQSKDAAANFIFNAGDHYLCVCTFNKFIGEETEILVLNFDDDLAPNDQVLDGQDDEFGKCMVQTEEDRFVVLGNRSNAVTGKSEVVLYQVETDGLLVSSSQFISSISESGADLKAERLVRTENGTIAIVGTRTIGGNSDMFLQIIRNYQPAERLYFGNEGDQHGRDIKIPGGGGFIVTGDSGLDGSGVISLIKTDEAGNI